MLSYDLFRLDINISSVVFIFFYYLLLQNIKIVELRLFNVAKSWIYGTNINNRCHNVFTDNNNINKASYPFQISIKTTANNKHRLLHLHIAKLIFNEYLLYNNHHVQLSWPRASSIAFYMKNPHINFTLLTRCLIKKLTKIIAFLRKSLFGKTRSFYGSPYQGE